MGSALVMHGDALLAGGKKKKLLVVSLLHSDCYAVSSEGGWGTSRLLESPRPHRRRMMESKVLSAVMSISLDHHVGVLRCGIGKEFLLRGALHVFEYHASFLF